MANQRDIFKKYPRLVAHLICESLGYFCPLSAANAIVSYLEGRPFACEWYSHMCSCRGKGYFDKETLLKIGKDTLGSAFRNRHRHKGYMAEYKQAQTLVKRELEHEGISVGMLASWF